MASALRVSRWLAPLAVIALTAGAMPPAHASVSGLDRLRVPEFAPRVDPPSGRPGEPVTVTFPAGTEYRGCGAAFAAPLAGCRRAAGDGTPWIVKLTVPHLPPQAVPLYWYAPPIVDRQAQARPSLPATFVDFEILEPDFSVKANRSAGDAGDPVVVTFASRTGGVIITRCHVQLGADQKDCRPQGVTADLAVPATGAGPLRWVLWYSLGRDGVGRTQGEIPFVIRPPPPEPDFTVVADPPSAGPGELVTVSFASPAKGITVDTCAAGFGRPLPCIGGHSVVLRVPAGARPATTITLAWTLTYRSTRPGEQIHPRTAEIPFLVGAVTRPRFVATVEPREAHPGDPVTVTFTSLNDDFAIVGCLAAFPSDAGDACRRSPRRWFAETRVPRDAQPGMTILRWGVASRSKDGQPGADNDSVEYRVLAPPPRTKPQAATTLPATVDPPQTLPAGGAPRFTAMTEPEAAVAGEPVTVTVTPVDPANRIASCSVTFAESTGTSCRHTAGGWAATVDVPAGAEPGVRPLDWDVTSRAGNGSGTIDYRVLAAGEPRPAAFAITPQPGSARAGAKVTVSARSLVDDVTITGCSTGFTDATMTPCRPAAGGWISDLTVPAAMPVGPGKVLWRLAYGRAGGGSAGSTGFSTFTVLDRPGDSGGRSWWDLLRTVVQLLGGAAFLVALVGWRAIAKRVRGRRAARRAVAPPDDAGIPPTVSVVARPHRDRMQLGTPDRNAPARDLITIVRHNPRAEPSITEEPP
jgi:hypothetical protein